MSHIKWNDVWQQRTKRMRFLLLGVSMLIMFAAVFFTLSYTETREGFVIEQWMSRFYGAPINFSIPIFALTYLCVGYGVSSTASKPILLFRLLSAYTIMQFMRVATLLLVPLDPHPEILPLSDPFLEMTFYNGRANLKDLFFSGHVATIAIIALSASGTIMRMVLWSSALAVGVMLVQQRVHYIADVAAAPLFAWAAVRISAFSSRSIS